MALKGLGVPENDIQVFMYSDYGLDLYSNAVIASPDLVKNNPKAVSGFVKASIKAWQDAVEPLRKQWADAVTKTGADAAAIYKEFQADISKARQLLGYAPTHRVADGMRATVEWHVARAGAGTAP